MILKIILSVLMLFCLIVAEPTLVSADTKLRVGDRVEETSRTDGHNIGVVKEVGTGSRAGCYLIVYDNDPSDPKAQGYWVCDQGLPGRLFVLTGTKRRDINEKGQPEKVEVSSAPGLPPPPSSVARNSTVANIAKEGSESCFTIGDRVEVLSGGKWYPGTVTRALEHNSYAVAMDKHANQGLPDYQATPGMIRRGGGTAPVPKPMPGPRPPMKCITHKGTNGAKPAETLARELVQCAFENTGGGALINVDIHSFRFGERRSWTHSDMGDGEWGRTVIYPVLVHLTKKTFGNTSVTVAEEDVQLKLYVDRFGIWVAGVETERLTRPLETIHRP